ncbi:MAG: hypothetical protein KBF47_07935, partial [Gemmatimonadales bacterium]|nr:hypothetical protein [Gemmatimonadales bacterium]
MGIEVVQAGAVSMITGSLPAVAVCTMRPRGFSPCDFAYSGEAISSALAPSTTPEEFPAWWTWFICFTCGYT